MDGRIKINTDNIPQRAYKHGVGYLHTVPTGYAVRFGKHWYYEYVDPAGGYHYNRCSEVKDGGYND